MNTTHEHALSQFRTEIRHFSTICILNLVFAALGMASGISYMVSSILVLTTDLASAGLRLLIAAVAMICFGLGLRWLLSSIRVFEGIEQINDDLENEGPALTEERITCLIVRMLAHYRDNRTTIGTMILVCTLGGWGFFVLGIAASLESLFTTSGSIAFTMSNLLVIPAMLLTLGIALTSLFSSYYFSKFAKVWDRRLHEIDESECALKKTLGLHDQ